MTRIKAEIEKALHPLIGLPLTKTTRSDAMQFFHFGQATVTNNFGLILDVGAYTLAVQDGWQICKNTREIASSDELFLPKQVSDSGAFDWRVPGASLGDQRLKDFLKQGPENLEVVSIQGSEGGAFKIEFSGGSTLKISCADERVVQETDGNTFWRFFSNTEPSENFIYNSAVM